MSPIGVPGSPRCNRPRVERPALGSQLRRRTGQQLGGPSQPFGLLAQNPLELCRCAVGAGGADRRRICQLPPVAHAAGNGLGIEDGEGRRHHLARDLTQDRTPTGEVGRAVGQLHPVVHLPRAGRKPQLLVGLVALGGEVDLSRHGLESSGQQRASGARDACRYSSGQPYARLPAISRRGRAWPAAKSAGPKTTPRWRSCRLFIGVGPDEEKDCIWLGHVRSSRLTDGGDETGRLYLCRFLLTTTHDRIERAYGVPARDSRFARFSVLPQGFSPSDEHRSGSGETLQARSADQHGGDNSERQHAPVPDRVCLNVAEKQHEQPCRRKRRDKEDDNE